MSAPTLTRRVTPTGVLLLPSTATREQWLAERKNGIGASEIPAIVGLSQYGTAMHVWADKTGRVEPEPMSEAALWGLELEDTVAREWAKRNRVSVRKVGVIAKDGDVWRRASLDRMVSGCPDGPCCLQVKCRSAFKAGQWSEQVPDDVQAQVQWELDVSGYQHSHVAALVGGNQLHDYVIEADPVVQVFLRSEAERVWGHVLADTPPDVDPSGLLVGLYDRMWVDREGARQLPSDAAQRLADYATALADSKDAKARQDAAKAALLGYLEGGEVGLFGDQPAFTYFAQSRRSTDLTALKANFPDAYAATVTETTSRTFRPKGTKS